MLVDAYTPSATPKSLSGVPYSLVSLQSQNHRNLGTLKKTRYVHITQKHAKYKKRPAIFWNRTFRETRQVGILFGVSGVPYPLIITILFECPSLIQNSIAVSLA